MGILWKVSFVFHWLIFLWPTQNIFWSHKVFLVGERLYIYLFFSLLCRRALPLKPLPSLFFFLNRVLLYAWVDLDHIPSIGTFLHCCDEKAYATAPIHSLRWVSLIFLSSLASNHDAPNLCLPTQVSYDYMLESPFPASDSKVWIVTSWERQCWENKMT
jgi:hypothetical protein